MKNNIFSLVFIVAFTASIFSCNSSDKKNTATEAIVYQIYPRSFKDSDGAGDLNPFEKMAVNILILPGQMGSN